MERITSEPTREQIDDLYMQDKTLAVTIHGHNGVIKPGPGGWGNVAIIVEFDDGTIITAKEREPEDYDDYDDDNDNWEPMSLQVYFWERENEEAYYETIEDALLQRYPCKQGL